MSLISTGANFPGDSTFPKSSTQSSTWYFLAVAEGALRGAFWKIIFDVADDVMFNVRRLSALSNLAT